MGKHMSCYEAAWLRDLTARMESNPSYIAEGIALDLAIQINKRLLALSLSRREYAGRLGVSQARISQMLGGQTNLTLLSLCKAAAAVGLVASVQFRPHEQRESAGESGFTSLPRLQQTCIPSTATDPSFHVRAADMLAVIPFHANVPTQVGVA